MNERTRQLLVALKKVNQQVPAVVLGMLEGSLSPEKQIEFGSLLIELGQLMQGHGTEQPGRVIDAEPTSGNSPLEYQPPPRTPDA